MVWRNFRRLLAAFGLLVVSWLTPKKDKATIFAIAMCANEMRKSID